MSPRALRVLHVIDTSFVGGGQTAVLHMIGGLTRAGLHTELACRDGGPLMAAAPRAGAVVHAVPFDKRYLPTRAAAVARIARRSRIDIVHSHGLLATYYCVLARDGFRLGAPLVYHQHGFHHHNHGPLTRSPRRFAERVLCRRADRVVAVSRSDAQQLVAARYAAPDSVRLIHYGLPLPDASSKEIETARLAIGADRRPVVGLVARLHPQKGVDTFLRAASTVRREVPDAVFAIVGSGPLEAALRQTARTLGLDGEVRWLGSDKPGVTYMPSFDVGVLSSRWEGLPLVLLEYMATARAIVATSVEGCLDAVGGDHVELVEPDDADAMAAAIVRLLRDPALAARRAAAAHARYEEAFTVEAMVSQIRALYNEVLS